VHLIIEVEITWIRTKMKVYKDRDEVWIRDEMRRIRVGDKAWEDVDKKNTTFLLLCTGWRSNRRRRIMTVNNSSLSSSLARLGLEDGDEDGGRAD